MHGSHAENSGGNDPMAMGIGMGIWGRSEGGKAKVGVGTHTALMKENARGASSGLFGRGIFPYILLRKMQRCVHTFYLRAQRCTSDAKFAFSAGFSIHVTIENCVRLEFTESLFSFWTDTF